MAKWTLRRANRRDGDSLTACFEAAYAPYAARIVDLPPVAVGLAEDIAKHQVWIAEIGKDLVGGLVLIPETGFMRLANVAVHPDHGGSGLGGALIALAETQAADQGYHEMRLTTHVDMPDNVRLYAHLGWQEDQRRGNKVSMRKTIRRP